MEDFPKEPTAALVVNPNERYTPTEANIRSEALTGLRGLASLHILFFHALIFSPLSVNTMGSMEMPLFFLLSGYSLTLSYGRTIYAGHTSCCCMDSAQTGDDQPPLFQSFNFYRNRFARIMPIYYLVNFVIALPLLAFGHGNVVLDDPNFISNLISAIIDSIAPIGMILPGTMWPFVGAGWTVSTLWFFYLVFPVIFSKFQKYTNEKASKWIVILFWIQLFGGILLWVALIWNPSPIISNYWVSTGWGVSRLPVFLIGVHAGLLRLRQYNNPNIQRGSAVLKFIHAWFPSRCLDQQTSEQQQQDDERSTQRKWATLINAVVISHVLYILLFAIIGKLLVDVFFANTVIQFLAIHSQLIIIDGLTRDGGKSILSKICNFRIMQEVGRFSMTLYLIHVPLMNWLCVAVHGNLRGKGVVPYRNIIPVWGIPVIVIISPIIAWVLTRCVEEPMRKLLRVPRSTSYV